MGEDMWTKGEGMWVRARACRGHVGDVDMRAREVMRAHT